MLRLSGQDRSFRHDGLLLEKGWSSFETLTEEQRACLRDYFGTHVRVHPDDYGELAKFGLQMQTDDAGNPNFRAPLVDIDIPVKNAKSDKGDANNKNAKSDKGDAKKEG